MNSGKGRGRDTRLRPATSGALFVLLASVYMITWSGRINSNDELLLLNASASLVRYGDMRADLAAGSVPPAPGDLRVSDSHPPLPDIRVEPLQPVLAAPLYWLALLLPGVGLAHSVHLEVDSQPTNQARVDLLSAPP